MRRGLRLTALLLSLFLLSGCTSAVPKSPAARVSLPPVENAYRPPQGEGPQEYAQTVLLCLPSSGDGQLIMWPERMLLPADQHPAEATLKKLLSFSGNERVQQLFPKASLQLQPRGLELSGDVATVNLGANALLLSRQDLFTLRRSIANTLLQWPEIRYVNVLVDGREPGLDEAARLPAGSLQQTRNEDAPGLWDSLTIGARAENPENQRFQSLCTLYFPTLAGRGILAEARTVSFRGQTPEQMARGLLEALSAGSQARPQLPQMPDLMSLLAAQPESQPIEGGRMIKLRFLEAANEIFIQAGVPRSVMLASLTYTLCGFIPDMRGLSVQIGNELVEAIVPSGIYEKAGEQIYFSGGMLRRTDFASFLLSECRLYFAQPSLRLVQVRRPVPHALAYSQRYLLSQLMLGPQGYDNVQGLQAIFPADIGEQDILDIQLEDGRAQVNFSGNFKERSLHLSPARERLLIYGMVNTLCDSRGVQRVALFVEGQQPDSLAGNIYLPGEFLKNPDIVAD